jgi:hypothetical protein
MCLLGVQVVTDTPAELRAIVTMRGNRLGAAIVGGDTSEAAGGPSGALMQALRERMSSQGLSIPERFRAQFGRFDTDNDGRLTTKEVDAMPVPLRTQIRQAIMQRLGGGED